MADSFDLKSHEQTWHGFCKLMKYSLGAIVIVLIFLALITL
ncbi:MAG: aa3-type cytochrome c oxidase subunit IV [Alphaproteobacteria bacterium]|nr:aa3-type cytochrome c oxidase subunit IV [Alphaproteobacteria bacterium]